MSMIINLSTTHVSCKSVKKFFFFVLHSITIFFLYFFFLFCIFLSCLFWFIWFGLVLVFCHPSTSRSLTPVFPPIILPLISSSLCICVYTCVHVPVCRCVYGIFFFSHFSLFKWFSTTISSW